MPKNTTRYWKIAPGERAWQWDECRDEGFIAVGWDELGDLSRQTFAQFEARSHEVATIRSDWSVNGSRQAWRFAHDVAVGDRVVANRGKFVVVGIGTVTGPYYFVPGVTYSHRLPVRWDEVTERSVYEQGWMRTIIELTREKFEAIVSAPGVNEVRERPAASDEGGAVGKLRAALARAQSDQEYQTLVGARGRWACRACVRR